MTNEETTWMMAWLYNWHVVIQLMNIILTPKTFCRCECNPSCHYSQPYLRYLPMRTLLHFLGRWSISSSQTWNQSSWKQEVRISVKLRGCDQTWQSINVCHSRQCMGITDWSCRQKWRSPAVQNDIASKSTTSTALSTIYWIAKLLCCAEVISAFVSVFGRQWYC